jgi:hypothetical protein
VDCVCPAKHSRERWYSIRIGMDSQTVKNILGEPNVRLEAIDTLGIRLPVSWRYWRDSVRKISAFCPPCYSDKLISWDENGQAQNVEESNTNESYAPAKD